MSAVLSEAETKFFDSGGTEVDSSLQQSSPEPVTPAPEPIAAPAPAPSKTPSPVPEPAKAPEPKPDDSRVPLEALHAERSKRQQLEQQLQQMQREWQQFQEALKQAQQPQPPDANEDPIGALSFQLRQQQEELRQLREGTTQQREAAQKQQAEQQFLHGVSGIEAEYSKTHADYTQAAQFAFQAYDRMLALRFPDPAQRAQVLRNDSLAALYQVVNRGGNPAEYVYNLAKSMGYTGPAPASTPAPAPIPAPAEVPEAVQKIQKGLKQQANLSSGGSTPPSELTPEMGANLNGKEFDKFWDQFKRSARR